MIRICVLGDIGSGKSYIAKQFGYPVFNADYEVSEIYKKNKKCFNELKKRLPAYIFSFPVKKKEINDAIISSRHNLKKVIKVVHPKIRSKLNSFLKKNRSKKFVVLDIPLLMENKINKKKDILVFIDAKKKEINRRLKKRLNFSKVIINKLKKMQLPLEHKKKHSHFIIKNNFKKNYVKKAVKEILSNA